MVRPTAVTRAVQLIWVLVLLGAAVTVLAVVFDEELVASWAGLPGQSVDDTRVPPTFVPVAVVLYGTMAILLLVLTAFLRGGHNWARHCIAASGVLSALVVLASLRTGPPTVFVALAWVFLLLDAVLLVLLYLPSTGAFVTRRPERTSTQV